MRSENLRPHELLATQDWISGLVTLCHQNVIQSKLSFLHAPSENLCNGLSVSAQPAASLKRLVLPGVSACDTLSPFVLCLYVDSFSAVNVVKHHLCWWLGWMPETCTLHQGASCNGGHIISHYGKLQIHTWLKNDCWMSVCSLIKVLNGRTKDFSTDTMMSMRSRHSIATKTVKKSPIVTEVVNKVLFIYCGKRLHMF